MSKERRDVVDRIISRLAEAAVIFSASAKRVKYGVTEADGAGKTYPYTSSHVESAKLIKANLR